MQTKHHVKKENRYKEFLLDHYEWVLKDRYNPGLNTYIWHPGDKEMLDLIRNIASSESRASRHDDDSRASRFNHLFAVSLRAIRHKK